VLVGKRTGPRRLESAGIEWTQLALSRPTEVGRSLPYSARPPAARACHPHSTEGAGTLPRMPGAPHTLPVAP
jgi:hypothetical protein